MLKTVRKDHLTVFTILEAAMVKIKVKEIWLNRAEGRIPLPRAVTVKTYKDAHDVLLDWSISAPKQGEGYDKTDIKVTFEDGETYSGRVDLKHFSCDDNDTDLAKHIRDHVLFYTGEHKPVWMTAAQYDQALNGVNSQEYKEFYEKYELNQ